MKRKDQLAHDEVCPEAITTCQKCQMSFKRQEADQHDCILALSQFFIASMSSLKEENKELRAKVEILEKKQKHTNKQIRRLRDR